MRCLRKRKYLFLLMILAQHICKHYICCVIFPPDISVRQGALSLDLNPTSHGYIDILETHEIRYLIIISHIIYTRRVLHILCWWGGEKVNCCKTHRFGSLYWNCILWCAIFWILLKHLATSIPTHYLFHFSMQGFRKIIY